MGSSGGGLTGLPLVESVPRSLCQNPAYAKAVGKKSTSDTLAELAGGKISAGSKSDCGATAG